MAIMPGNMTVGKRHGSKTVAASSCLEKQTWREREREAGKMVYMF